jgi:hypothetical protein
MEGRAEQPGPDQGQRQHPDTNQAGHCHKRQQSDYNPAGKAKAQTRHGGEKNE